MHKIESQTFFKSLKITWLGVLEKVQHGQVLVLLYRL